MIRRIVLHAAGLALLFSTAALAQPAAGTGDRAAVRPSIETGDAWLDRQLAGLAAYAERYPDAFADELERYAGVPRAYTTALATQPGWTSGDVWFACSLARALKATCRSVVRARAQAGADGDWKQVADGFEAAPGDAAYRQVRLALADSHRRWDRPLEPDAALRRALRERDEQRRADRSGTSPGA